MSVTLMSQVFKCNMPELKTDDGKTVPDTTAKFVLLALADNANDEGEGSYPGIDTLCQKTNFSTATVCNALNALRHNGFTELVGKSKYDTNNYTILAAKIREFQWLKRSDFSRYNPTTLAAKTNPSVKPSVKPLDGEKENFSNDPVTAELAFARSKAPELQVSLDIESKLKMQLGLNATSTKGGMEFVNYAVKRQKEGEDFQRFLDWWKVNGGDRKYWSFNKMRENWPAAFMDEANRAAVVKGVFYA